MANKTPAFPLYASEFLGDTDEMTNEEVGMYIRLLCVQWVNGSIPGNPDRLPYCEFNNLAYTDPCRMPIVWGVINDKFEIGENGRLRNPGLESTRQKKVEYLEKQQKNGARGAKKRWGVTGVPVNSKKVLSRKIDIPTQAQNSCPSDFKPDELHLNILHRAGCPVDNITTAIPVFVDHYHARGKNSGDWQETFLQWMLYGKGNSWLQKGVLNG